MPITLPPTTPSRNSPATFSADMDAWIAWFNGAVPQMNAVAAGTNDSGTFNAISVDNQMTGNARRYIGGLASAVGGTANAITLTLSGSATLVTGQTVRFVATASNTGATTINLDGSGVKSCVTVTGAALPSGYIRTGVVTEAYYNGTNWVVDRAPEYGSNANGEYWRYADGRQVCINYINNDSVAWTTADGSLFRLASAATWTYPAAFATVTPTVTGAVEIGARPAGVNFVSLSSSSVAWHGWAATSAGSGTAKRVMLSAVGLWY